MVDRMRPAAIELQRRTPRLGLTPPTLRCRQDNGPSCSGQEPGTYNNWDLKIAPNLATLQTVSVFNCDTLVLYPSERLYSYACTGLYTKMNFTVPQYKWQIKYHCNHCNNG